LNKKTWAQERPVLPGKFRSHEQAKNGSVFCIRPIFCQYPEKIGRIEIGKSPISIRPIFSGYWQIIGRMQKTDPFFGLFV
jgi:hypothetical protein